MSRNVIALILAAGLAGFSYHYVGRRQGYSNPKQVWWTTGFVFLIGYLLFLSIFIWFIHI
ncbi:MAG: hypothetical protein ACREF7_03685 [Candidatus Saccharimonadales bacterium]